MPALALTPTTDTFPGQFGVEGLQNQRSSTAQQPHQPHQACSRASGNARNRAFAPHRSALGRQSSVSGGPQSSSLLHRERMADNASDASSSHQKVEIVKKRPGRWARRQQAQSRINSKDYTSGFRAFGLGSVPLHQMHGKTSRDSSRSGPVFQASSPCRRRTHRRHRAQPESSSPINERTAISGERPCTRWRRRRWFGEHGTSGFAAQGHTRILVSLVVSLIRVNELRELRALRSPTIMVLLSIL